MCIFSQTILSVADTLIFGRLTDRGTQYLAYEMEYESETPNAMILPLPVRASPSESAVRFIDLSGYEKFFKDLSRAFPAITKYHVGSLAKDVTRSKLVVHEVGSFIASFVPTVEDFARLDSQFGLPKSTWDLIPEYSDYGFAVFQLKQLSGKPHPMAFEFETRSDSIFFPTMHIHDGEVHSMEEFDHSLFMQHAEFDKHVGNYAGPKKIDRQTGLVRSKGKAGKYINHGLAQGIVDPKLLLHQVSINGEHPNSDLTYSRDRIRPKSGLSRLLKFWPVALLGGMAAWIINRRNLLAAKKQTPVD